MFKVLRVEQEERKINIYFSGKSRTKKVNMVFRLRDSERFIIAAAKEEFYVECNEVKENEYMATINTDDFLQKFTEIKFKKEVIWVYINTDDKYYDLKVNNSVSDQIKELVTFDLNSLSKCRLFVRKNLTLGFMITLVEIEAKILNIEQEGKTLKIKSQVNDKEGNEINDYELCLGKRMFNNVLRYSEFLLKQSTVNGENLIELNEKIFMSIKENGINYIDFIVQVKQDNVIVKKLINIKEFNKITNIIEDSFKYEIYKTASNTLALKVEKLCYSKNIDKLSLDYGKLNIKFKDGNLSSGRNLIQIYRKIGSTNKSEDILFYEEEIDHINEVEIDLDIVFDIDTNYDQKYYVLLNADNKIYSLKDNSGSVLRYKNIIIKDSKELTISVNEKTNNTIRLAVLGSCFSRAAFSSKEEYFNVDYKKYIDLVYTDFWISLISVYSKNLEYPKEKFADLSDKEKTFIDKLYLKDTMSKLKESKIEYILIDFFADAVHGVRKFKNGSYIGQNNHLHKSLYYFNDLMVNTENFDYRNEQFWPIWKEACDKFILDLKEMKLDKCVILNCSSLTDRYYDKNGKIRYFDAENKFKNKDIKYYNNIWKRMNSYFLAKLPNAKVINLDKYDYISSYNHPISCGPHHFETAYYKKLKDEVLETILVEERKK